jgi:hypothetical protein
MIVDVHSHACSFPDHFSEDFRKQAKHARGGGAEIDLTVRLGDYEATASPETKAHLNDMLDGTSPKTV